MSENVRIRWCPIYQPTQNFHFPEWEGTIPQVGDSIYENELGSGWSGMVVYREFFLDQRLWGLVVHSFDRAQARRILDR